MFNQLLSSIKYFLKEFRKNKAGVVGVTILAASLLVVLFENQIITYKEAGKKWRDITYWQDNSASAPPLWINFFKDKKYSVTQKIMPEKEGIMEETVAEKNIVIEKNTTEETISQENVNQEDIKENIILKNKEVYKAEFIYNFTASYSPLDTIFHFLYNGDAIINIKVVRPDKESFVVYEELKNSGQNTNIRVSLFTDSKNKIFRFYRESVPRVFQGAFNPTTTNPISILFSEKKEDMAEIFYPLNGDYKFEVTITPINSDEITIAENMKSIKSYMVTVGSVSGIMGTDNMKRDIFSGLVIGLKWALFIGMLTSFVAVIVGVMYGIISAYFSGTVDSVMQFIYQIFIGIPTLPVMIVLSAVFKPSIWTMIIIMIVFSWTGSVMTVRSIAMQLKEETFIEAARSLGATHKRIIFKHLAPILLPFSFASMALAVPSAILYESSLSLLGLGDATIVTWGQILHDAMKGSAVLSGLWWWIAPPGIFIGILGMSFAFLGFALDKILHPKLKTR